MKELPKDLPKVGQGIMRFDNIYSKEGILKYQKIIDYMMEQNCNYFEAATFYLNHHCEELLRHFLRKYPRNSYFLADKIDPRELYRKMECQLNKSQVFMDLFNNQLKKLNTDYFDFYLLQALDRTCINFLTEQKFYDIINTMKQEGKIHYLGFSFHDTPEYLEYFLKQYKWDFVQIQFNYYNYYNGIAKELYDIAKKYNVPVFVMGSTQGGLLSNLPVKNNKVEFDTAIAINFLKKFDNIKLVLNGTDNLADTIQNINFWKNQDVLEIDEKQIVDNINKNNFIDCTGCGYCLNTCPNKINIKKIFQLYNNIINGKTTDKKEYLDLYVSNSGPMHCMHCGNCEKRCPQHLPIREKMKFLVMKFRA